jgi:hypothetical protein
MGLKSCFLFFLPLKWKGGKIRLRIYEIPVKVQRDNNAQVFMDRSASSSEQQPN